MLFRAPTDQTGTSREFYNNQYQQDMTTAIPSLEDLTRLKETRFEGTPKDYRRYISVLDKLKLRPSAKVFDYGCSWGYGSWQLQQYGFEVSAFEIAVDRANFAERELGISIIHDIDQYGRDAKSRNAFDCFFSSHVLEHVPRPASIFRLASRLLKPGGLFVSFTPNGSSEARMALPNWNKLWGQVHPNFVDDRFLLHAFEGSCGVLTSRNVGDTAIDIDFPKFGIVSKDLSKYELVFAVKKPLDGWDF